MTHSKFLLYIRPYLLPFLLAVYVPLFYYANNAVLLLLPSLIKMVLFSIILAAMLYALFFAIKKQGIQAANAAFIFLFFFHTYGVVYDYLITLDAPVFFSIRHRFLLPFFLLLALLISWFFSKIDISKSITIWNGATFIVGMLVIFNVITIIPVEVEKGTSPTAAEFVTVDPALPTQEYPDIYFIIFDEFSGFQPMRVYWNNPNVDDFVDFLKSKGFFIAEESHSSSITSLHQMSERLNYEELPCCEKKYHELYYEKIANNRVMSYLKSKGYSTVAMEELTEFIDAATPITVDYSFNYSANEETDKVILFDEFGIFIADNSMLRAYPVLYTQGEDVARTEHRKFIFGTVNRVAKLDQVASPKFVYVHLVFPHKPFMFDENGKALPKRFQANWNYYLGQYNYSMDIAKEIVESIISESDPDRPPPIIILQSDHGARNLKNKSTTVILENFPEDFKSNIMFALYIPGYDTSALPQDIKPINTFPIIFNYLFDDIIPLK